MELAKLKEERKRERRECLEATRREAESYSVARPVAIPSDKPGAGVGLAHLR